MAGIGHRGYSSRPLAKEDNSSSRARDTSDSGYGRGSAVVDSETHSEDREELQKRLLRACQYGKLVDVRELVAGRKVELKNCIAKNPHGDTPLHIAAYFGHKSIVEYLVEEADCDVESRNGYKNTPLHRAANRGHLEVVKYLVEEKGNDPMCECRWNRTPLHNACKHGRLKVVKYFLKIPNLDPTAKDSVLQSTPLQLAAEWGTMEVVQCMIEHGVVTDSDSKYTLLHLAAYGGKLDTVQYLIREARYEPMVKDKENKTPLHSACAGGYLKVVRYLVEDCEVNVNCHDNRYNEFPLDTASTSGRMDVVKYLVEEKECVIEHGIVNQNTALHHAAIGGALDVVEYFIEERKCSPSCQGRKGRRPLHFACMNNKENVVNYLVGDHKADASPRDHTGATPLHLAARKGHLALVKELITKYECDKLVKDNDGKTPLDYASEKHMATVIDFLYNFSESNKLLEEAMKEGYVIVKLVKVIVVGPAGVGKSSLIYLLLGKDPPEERNSTGCAEQSIRVIRVGKEGKEWKEIPTNEFQEIIAEAIPILLKDLTQKDHKTKEPVKKTKNETSDGFQQEYTGESRSGAVIQKGGTEDNHNPSVSKTKDVEKTISQDGKAAIADVKGKLTMLIGDGKTSSRLLEMEQMYLTDTGGQQAYWDLVPIFTRDTSATIFTHRLCERLDEHPLNELYESGKRVGPEQRARLTTADAFKTILQGLHESTDYHGKTKRSIIIVVGTHKDLVEDCKETLQDKNNKLKAIASPDFKEHIVYCDTKMDEMIFQVNTKTPGDNDKKEASKIRDSIEKTAMEMKIPIWWFILQQILEGLAERLDRHVLSKQECIQVSESLGFTVEELNAALAFLDKLNIFLYKKDILPGVVFTNAKVPLDKVSKLVYEKHKLKAAETDPARVCDRAITGIWKMFRDNGILTLPLLEELKKQYEDEIVTQEFKEHCEDEIFTQEFKEHYVDEIFTPKDFLDLLERLLIISKLPKHDKYLFPAILDTADNIHIAPSEHSAIAPLVVWFPTGWAPPGVFCCSVCHLLSQAGWQIKPASCTYRNSIEFIKDDKLGSMTLIDNFSFFAVCVNVDVRIIHGSALVRHCGVIKHDVFAAVKAGLEKTHQNNSPPKPAFLCPAHKNELPRSELLHVAHVASTKQHWMCSQNHEYYNSLTPDQTVWLGGPAPPPRQFKCVTAVSQGKKTKLDTNLFNMKSELRPVTARWKHIGLALGLDPGQLDVIEADNRKVDDCLTEMLTLWLNSNTERFGEPLWELLASAVGDRAGGNNSALAKEITEKITESHKWQQSQTTLTHTTSKHDAGPAGRRATKRKRDSPSPAPKSKRHSPSSAPRRKGTRKDTDS